MNNGNNMDMAKLMSILSKMDKKGFGGWHCKS